MTEIQTIGQADIVERVVAEGDLAALTAPERVLYYRAVCQSLGLNPLTKPFEYIRLNGKLTLYPRRDATDQLRKIHGVALQIVSRDWHEDVYIVTARATARDGRTDESTGVVATGGLKGETLANAMMKAETKAKRRVTLSIVGLGWADESEIDSIPSAQVVTVQPETGEILKDPPTQPEAPAHWGALGSEGRMRVMAKKDELGMTLANVREALTQANGKPVVRLTDFEGTEAEAIAALERWWVHANPKWQKEPGTEPEAEPEPELA